MPRAGRRTNHVVRDTDFEMELTRMYINCKSRKTSGWKPERPKTTPNQFEMLKQTKRHWSQRQIMDTQNSVKTWRAQILTNNYNNKRRVQVTSMFANEILRHGMNPQEETTSSRPRAWQTEPTNL